MASVVVVTPNPAVDVTYTVPRQVVGETIRVEQVVRRPGGKGLNVVRVLRHLGVHAVAVHPLGGSAGTWMREALERDRVEARTVEVAGETRTTVAVVGGSDHPTLYSEPGEPLDDEAWRRLADAAGAALEPGGMLVVAGSFPPGTDSDRVAALVDAGRTAGGRVLVDASGVHLLAAADAGAELLKPNVQELLGATGADDLDAGMRELLTRGARAIAVSRGSDGLVALTADGQHATAVAVPGVSGNPTGAGDAATAGLVAALQLGHPLDEALRWASLVGAAAVLSPTAGQIDPAVLPELAARLDAQHRPQFPLPVPIP